LQTPYWIEKETGIKLTESKAILKHIALEYAPDLLPKTNAEHRDADTLESLVTDTQFRLAMMAYSEYKVR
jgi:glutathione S-transferase